MSGRYNVTLRDLMQHEETMKLLNKALSTYPMYKPENKMTYSLIPTREELNQKILNHYKNREIGLPTIAMFCDELEISMIEIMPKYYQLYKSVDIMNGIEDPFGNVDITETFEEETEGNSEGKSTLESKNKSITSNSSESENSSTNHNESKTSANMEENSKNIESQTPQGMLEIATDNINSIKYGDKATWNQAKSNSNGSTTDDGKTSSEGKTKDSGSAESESESSGSSNNKTQGKTNHVFTKKGNQGVNTYAHDMEELRKIFLNIEQQIINDERISELFMRVY